MTALPIVLNEKVLVLNRYYTAIRVINARRAFTMLCKAAAEIISVEDGQYITYDLESWTEIAELQRQFEPDAHAWVRTPQLHIAVPKIIRLFGYDRLPRQEVKLNRRNLYARDGNHCQYCGKTFPTRELTIDHVVPRCSAGTTPGPTSCARVCVATRARAAGRRRRPTCGSSASRSSRDATRPSRSGLVNHATAR